MDSSFCSFLIVLSILIGLTLPLLVPMHSQQVFDDYKPSEASVMPVRKVSAVSYQLPAQLICQQQIFPRSQLLQGRMLLMDETHPLPPDLLPPNTASIAQYGAGMVPVHSLQLRSGRETIDALKALFAQLKAEEVEGLYVDQGTVSIAQQKHRLVQHTRQLMQHHSPDEAVFLALEEREWPGTGSLLREYTVEIRTADGALLEQSIQGQRFLQLCWRYGFVRESAEKPFRFRYVGKAHATAMTYLALDLRSYLEQLHTKECLVIAAGGQPQYLILCQPVQNGYAAFDLPYCTALEVSMDNTGYALTACTL